MLIENLPIILAVMYIILMICSFSISSSLSGSKVSKNYTAIAIACLIGTLISLLTTLQQHLEILGSIEFLSLDVLYALSILLPLTIIVLSFLSIAITYSKYT